MNTNQVSNLRKSAASVELPHLISRLNALREKSSKPPISYAVIAKALKMSRATVAALCTGNYHASTASLHNLNIAAWLCKQIVTEQPPKANRRTTLVHVDPTGYFRLRNRHYFAGSAFAGSLIEAAPLRGRDHAVTIILGQTTRTIFPINPAGNQLGYHPPEALR
ncbi:hypothetical protein CVU37_09130 [candidate division BRC1 bacterium HGW-BRC1-1]|jgi:hypothetical protein|nr:MAG: hypothetical protein CVU37_09130 [candidate division BRC1 bacterium HGW-BRC1-1]